jgi:hypothetical protein
VASSTTDPHSEHTGQVGVVVVSFNSEEQLPACLAALGRATGVAAVVVVDNASRDRSAELVRSSADPRVRLLALDVNTGFAGGCNRGFAALPRELPWVAFVNPDVVVSADCLSAATAVADPTVAGVAPRLMRPDGVTVDSVGQLLDRRTLEVRDRGYGQPLSPCCSSPARCWRLAARSAVYRRPPEAVDDGGPCGDIFCFGGPRARLAAHQPRLLGAAARSRSRSTAGRRRRAGQDRCAGGGRRSSRRACSRTAG